MTYTALLEVRVNPAKIWTPEPDLGCVGTPPWPGWSSRGELAVPETLELYASGVTILPYSAFHSTVAAGAMVTRAPKTDILLIKDVAEYLKVTERTIYRLAAAKKIPAFKVGGSWRFSRADIDAWIKAQTSITPSGEE
jgi:excisionase family DNA binding protein